MNILAWIVLGGLAGWIGSMLAKTDHSQGIILNVVVGIIGAFIGGIVFNFFGGAGVTGFNIYILLVAIIGSVLLITLIRWAKHI